MKTEQTVIAFLVLGSTALGAGYDYGADPRHHRTDGVIKVLAESHESYSLDDLAKNVCTGTGAHAVVVRFCEKTNELLSVYQKDGLSYEAENAVSKAKEAVYSYFATGYPNLDDIPSADLTLYAQTLKLLDAMTVRMDRQELFGSGYEI